MPNQNVRRVKIPSLEELTKTQQKIYDDIKYGKRNEVTDLFMVLMHSPEIASRTQALGEKLRYDTSIPKKLSELAILIVARFWRCPYEWHYHEPEAIESGLDIEIIKSIKELKKPYFKYIEEESIYNFTNELLYNRCVDDMTYEKALSNFGEKGVVELTSLIGYYCMIAMTLNEHNVPLPNNSSAKIPSTKEKF